MDSQKKKSFRAASEDRSRLNQIVEEIQELLDEMATIQGRIVGLDGYSIETLRLNDDDNCVCGTNPDTGHSVCWCDPPGECVINN